MTSNVRAGKASQQHEEALKEVMRGKIVHLFNTDEPHITNEQEVCWCQPGVQQYDTGGVLVIHQQVRWQ